MKFRCLYLLLIAFLVSSCILEKRHYCNGFYVNWNQNAFREAEVRKCDTSGELVDEVQERNREQDGENPGPETETAVQDEVADTMQAQLNTAYPVPESHRTELKGSDEPRPEENDKINPKIGWLVAGGFLLELSLSLILLFGTTQWVGWFVLLAMLLGLGMFVLARHLRNTYVQRTSAGEKDPKLRVSAHYHRFRVLLHMYFASGAIGLLGWFFLYTAGAASGILSLLGVILFSSGVVLLAGIALVLLVLFVMYFLRWRKDPTGYKPPRDPHPPKDR